MKIHFKNIIECQETIPLIARWYFEGWGFDISQTSVKLNQYTHSIPLQIVGFVDEEPVVTAGIYNEVNLLRFEPQYKKYQSWLSLLYTIPSMRSRGIRGLMLDYMDRLLFKMNISQYYLYTNTAEQLYLRKGWVELERIIYQNKDTVFMIKELAGKS